MLALALPLFLSGGALAQEPVGPTPADAFAKAVYQTCAPALWAGVAPDYSAYSEGERGKAFPFELKVPYGVTAVFLEGGYGESDDGASCTAVFHLEDWKEVWSVTEKAALRRRFERDFLGWIASDPFGGVLVDTSACAEPGDPKYIYETTQPTARGNRLIVNADFGASMRVLDFYAILYALKNAGPYTPCLEAKE